MDEKYFEAAKKAHDAKIFDTEELRRQDFLSILVEREKLFIESQKEHWADKTIRIAGAKGGRIDLYIFLSFIGLSALTYVVMWAIHEIKGL